MSKHTKRVRAEVAARAEGNCEACSAWVGLDGESGHLDHFFGRAKAEESVSTCWLLCGACDTHKTLNKPTAVFWLVAFISHAEKHSYAAELEMAHAKLGVRHAKTGRAA